MTNEELTRFKILKDKSLKSVDRISAKKSEPPLTRLESRELGSLQNKWSQELKSKFNRLYFWLLDLFTRMDFARLKNCEIPNFSEEYEPEVEEFLPVMMKLRELKLVDVKSVKLELYEMWVRMFSVRTVPSEADVCWERCSEEIIEVLNGPGESTEEFLSLFNKVQNGSN